MATVGLEDHVTAGDATLDRLADLDLPQGLAPHVKRFAAAHGAFKKAAEKADEAKKKRDQALAAIGAADADLDETIDPLANSMIGAGLGTRRAPFGDASPHSPTELKKLPYTKEVAATRDLVDKVSAKKPPAGVKACLNASSAAADASEAALNALTAPQAAYSRALGARDALLPEWSRSFAKLRVNAKAAWHDEPEIFASVFAPPEKVQRPVKKKAKKRQGETPAKGGDK